MAYKDAITDGIRIQKDKYGADWYYPKCHLCGEEVPSLNYRRGIKYTCKACKLENRKREKITTTQAKIEKRQKMLSKAIARISKHTSIKKYEKAIAVVEQMTDECYHAFDSTEEIMVALVLLQNDIQFRHQVRFGARYTADFVLDEQKVVLEVDGDIYHGKEKQDYQRFRDDLIIAALGPEWEMLRIKTSTINQNVTRLPKAIKLAVERRKLYRTMNRGQLPTWYSHDG